MDKRPARRPSAPGLPSIAPELRPDPAIRRRLSGPALRTFFRIAEAWSLTVAEQRALLGWPATSTFHKYKLNDHGTLAFDTLTRISLVLGIYKALQVLYPDQSLADRWVRLPNANPIFGGRPALTLMVDGGMDGLLRTRRLVDARRGGWN
jgi:hypothetical protein